MPRRKGYRSLPRNKDSPSSVFGIASCCQKLKCLSRPLTATTNDDEADDDHPFTSHVMPKTEARRNEPPLLETTMDTTGIETSLFLCDEEQEEAPSSCFSSARESLIGSVLVIGDRGGDHDCCHVERTLGDPLVYTYSAGSNSSEEEEVLEVELQWIDQQQKQQLVTTEPSLDHVSRGRDRAPHEQGSILPERERDISPLRFYEFASEEAFFTEANAWRSSNSKKQRAGHHHRSSDASTSATLTTVSNSSASNIRSTTTSTTGGSSSRPIKSLSSAAYDRWVLQHGMPDHYYNRSRLDGFYNVRDEA